MAGPVRNFCVARGRLDTQLLTPVFTVPAEYSFILKSIMLFAETATTAEFGIYVQASDASSGVWVLSEAPGEDGVIAFSSWMVLNAHDVLQIFALGTNASYWVSGALLPYGSAIPPIASTQQAPHPPPAKPGHGPPPTYVRIIP